MISQLAIASLLLGGSPDVAPSTQPAVASNEVDVQAVAKMLAEAADAKGGVAPREVARQAAETLGNSWAASTRLRDVAASPESTSDDAIRKSLKQIAADLGFKPTNEAPVPKGWPAFTPVREVRLVSYPKYRMAIVESTGAGEQGAFFWQLFTHIQRNEIPMTAPVEMHLSKTDKGLAMTGMAFLYENPDQPTPAGTRGNVKVVDIEPYEAVNVGLRGEMNDREIKAAQEMIDAWLKANESTYEVQGTPRILGYNSPSLPAAKKYYEVQVVVKRKG
jgi:hypothetical protein